MFKSSNALKMAEYLGRPCLAFSVHAGCAVVDPANGHELFAILNMNEISNMELILINPEKNNGCVFHAPKGHGSWGMIKVSNDCLIIGTYYDGEFVIFNLKKMKFIKCAKFPGAEYIRSPILGKDGFVYGGGYPTGSLASLDLNTYEVRVLGRPNLINDDMRCLSILPDGRIICYCSGKGEPSVWLFDPFDPNSTNRFHNLSGDLKTALDGAIRGVIWNDYFLPRLPNGGIKALESVSLKDICPLPFPLPPNDRGGYHIDTTLTTKDRLFIHQIQEDINTGSVFHFFYSYIKGDKHLTEITKKKIDLHGGRVFASSSKGEILGIRGQDYFLIKPGDETLNIVPIPTKCSPREILFLKADPDRCLWGGPRFGQTLFRMNPHTRDFVNYPIFCDADGEIYDIAFYNGKIYAVAYAGGDIIQYDPNQPWDQLDRKNPRTIASVGLSPANSAKCHPTKSYNRPTGGIVLGPDSKLYSGWKSQFDSGSAIAKTDPNTGETEIIEIPQSWQTISGLAVDEEHIYFTSLETNWLGIIDIYNKKIKTYIPLRLDSCDSFGPIALDKKTKKILIASRLKSSSCEPIVFDTLTMRFSSIPMPPESNIKSRTISAPGNGKAYYGNDKKQIISLDLKCLKIAILGELPENADAIAAGKSLIRRNIWDIYASCRADIYRIKG